MQWLRS
jgi:hypothetical protein